MCYYPSSHFFCDERLTTAEGQIDLQHVDHWSLLFGNALHMIRCMAAAGHGRGSFLAL